MILAQLPDERQRIAQAAGKHKLRVFAAFNAALDELDQTEDVDFELMFLEQGLDAAQLFDGERETRWWGGLRANARPIEIKIGSFVVTRREDVIRPRPEVTVAREKFCLGELREVVPDAGTNGIATGHKGGGLFGMENAVLVEGAQWLNGDETRRGQTGKGQRAVTFAVFNQPVNAADLVDFRGVDGRQALGEQGGLGAIVPPQSGLTMHDAVGEAPQGTGELRNVARRKSVLGEPANPLRQIEGVARKDNLKFNFVVKMGLGEETVDVVVHQPAGKIVRHAARHEGIEADSHVDIGQAVKVHQQRKTAKILIPVVVALIGPDRVGYELAIQR